MVVLRCGAYREGMSSMRMVLPSLPPRITLRRRRRRRLEFLLDIRCRRKARLRFTLPDLVRRSRFWIDFLVFSFGIGLDFLRLGLRQAQRRAPFTLWSESRSFAC